MSLHIKQPSRREWLALALILLLAAALRMGAPGISEFKLDEARLSLLALNMARGHEFPLLGIGSSVGIPNMPVSVWLFALPYLFSSDPTVATLYVGLLNVAAVALTWWLARRYFGPRAALIAALLYAVSPWGVIYSRKIWAQNLLPPFVLLTVGTGMIGLLEKERPRRWRWLVAHFALLLITIQIHYAAVTLIPLTLWMLWLGRHNLTRRTRLIIGSGIVMTTLTIAGAVLVMQARGVDLSVFGRNGLGVTAQAFYHFAITITGNEIHSLAGPEQYQSYLDETLNIASLQNVFGWLVLAAAAWAGVRAWQDGPGLCRRLYLTLIAWLLLPVAVFSITWTPSFPHYMIPLMPAAYLLFAAGIREAKHALPHHLSLRQRRVIGLLGGGILLIFSAAQAWNTAALYNFLDRTATPGGFGTPLHYLLDVREALLTAHPDDVLIVGISDDAQTDQDTAVWELLLYDLPSVRPLNGTSTAVLAPPDNRLLLNTASFYRQAQAMPGNRCGSDARRFDLRPGEGAYVLCTPPDEVTASSDVLGTFGGGIRLVSAAIYDSSEPRIRLGWASDGPLPGNYTAFNHLLNTEGQRIGQRDSPLWPGHFWREGEVILHDFPLPSDVDVTQAATLRVGVYQLINGQPQNLDVLDEAGNPAGQWIDIPMANVLTDDQLSYSRSTRRAITSR